MGQTVKQFTLCSIVFLIFVAGCHGDTRHTCPIYVSEGVHLLCDCQYFSSGTVAPGTLTIEWLNASATAQLRVDNVGRQMNGRSYTCRVSLNGQPVSSVPYTLQVAYGPSDSDVSILGPNPLRVDGASPVTLTCTVTAVNPAPAITWSGIQCSEGYTSPNCTFILSETDRGKTVKCEAKNDLVQPMGAVGTARITLDVDYPPDPPEITGYSPGQTLKTGDVLVCTVRGGHPLAAVIIFHCVIPINLLDEVDTRGTDYVQSSVTVNTSRATSSALFCVCTSTWSTNTSSANYTNNTAVVQVPIEYTPPSTTPTIPTTTSIISTTATSPSTTSTSTTIITPATTVTSTRILTTTAYVTTTSQSSTLNTSATESKTTTPVVVVTPSGTTTASVNSTTPGSTLTSFPVAAFAGGLAGGALLVLIIIIIAVTCRRKKEQDLNLTSAADFSNGSYKHTADQEFYMYDNNDYGNKDMMEIASNSPILRHNHSSSSNNNNVSKDLDHDPDRALSFYTSVPAGLHSTQEASLDLNAEISGDNPVVQAHGGAAFGDQDDTHGGAVYSVDRDEDDGTPDPSPSRKSGQRALKTVINVGGPVRVTSSAPRAQRPQTVPKKSVGFDVDVKEDDEDGDDDYDLEYNEEEFPLPPSPLPAEVVLGEPFKDPTNLNEAQSGMMDVYIPESRHYEQSASMAFAVE